MTNVHPDAAIDPDDPSLAALLTSDPLDWAHRATLLVYDRHAAPLAARADRRAQCLQRDGDPLSAGTVRRDAVHLLRHTCTNYEELVADVAAHYGHGRRDDVIAVIRHRALRALAHRFPVLADVCRSIADERTRPPRAFPVDSRSLGRPAAHTAGPVRPGT